MLTYNESVETIIDKFFRVGLRGLTIPEQILYLVWIFDREIHNGGFSQFFFNTSGNHYRETVEALKTVGAFNSQRFLEEAATLFFGSEVPTDRDERTTILDARLDELDRAIDEHYDRYAAEGEDESDYERLVNDYLISQSA